jgi:hypothetical protein
MEDLTLQQEKFCRLYTQNDELFGNGTLAYAEAYGYDLDAESKERPILSENPLTYGESDYTLAYNTCSVNASRLLRSDKIQDRVTVLLNELLKDEVVDSELARIIKGGRKDSDRMTAIKEYNALKQRVTKKMDITTKGESINTADPKAVAVAQKYEDELKQGL